MRRLAQLTTAAVLVVATIVAVAGRADAAAGDPEFLGGNLVAGYTGNVDPSISSNGTDALVVWTQTAGQGGTADVYGRLMKWDSTSVRPNAFRISLRADAEYSPDVVWNGSSWLVVWESETPAGDHVVRGRRVSKDGALLGSELPISVRAGGVQEAPAVTAGANGQFFVVWSDDRNDETTAYDIFGRRISSAGALMDGTGTRLSNDSESTLTDDEEADVAWNGEYFFAVWTAHLDVGAYSEIDGSAYKPGSSSRPHTGYLGGAGTNGTQAYPSSSPAVAASGKSFLVVYDYTAPNSLGTDIHATRLNGTGTQWARNDFDVARRTGDQQDPVVAANGNFLAAWRDRRNPRSEVWGARIGTDATVTDPNSFLITDVYPTSRLPAVTKGTSKAGTFSLTFEETPSGQGAGLYGSGFQNAPK